MTTKYRITTETGYVEYPTLEAAVLAHPAATPETIVYSEGALDPGLSAAAKNAFDKTDLVAIRCVKAGVAYPVEWKTYVTDLRAIVNGGAGPLPLQPEYPQGT